MRTNELMLYKHMENGQILQDITFLIENYQNDYYNMEDMKGLLYDAVNEILEMAVSHGFEGDLWHNYLTYLMASHENAYSTSCEIVGSVQGIRCRKTWTSQSISYCAHRRGCIDRTDHKDCARTSG